MKNILDGAVSWNYTIVWRALIIMGIFYLVAQDLPSYFFRNAYNKRWYWVKISLYQRYMWLFFTSDNNAIETLGTGKIQSIIFSGCNSWQTSLTSVVQQWFKMVLSIILWFIIIWQNVWFIWFSIVLCIFIGSYIFVQYGNKLLAWLRKKRRDASIEWDKRFVRMIMSKNEILQNNKSNTENIFIKTHYDTIFWMWLKESRKQIRTFDLQKITFTVLRIWILRYALVQVQQWNYSIGTIGLLWMLVNQIYGNIFDLNEFIINFHQDYINIEKLRDTFKDTAQIKWYNDGSTFIPNTWAISLENITYNYWKGEVLENLSLHIEWGKRTALIWVSWSWKSTLIKLVAWYLYPQSWKVFIDNQELPNPSNSNYVSLSSYYKHIWYLTQEPSVFDGTIYENLTYALDHEPSEKDLQDAIQWAQCQFIYEFPEGVQTQIGEKWIKLSGWQRQRLAIAKVFLKNPTIVLLDEPTSALDSFSEEEVSKALNNLFTWRTVIIIAHRLQTVKNADRIIVLEKWNIVEEWNHRSLVLTGWVYAKMLELQSGF